MPESSCAEPCPSENEVLAFICGELESSALERLLLHTERCGSCALVVAEVGLAHGATEGLSAPSTARGSSRAVFVPGQLVAGRYLVERRVGRGGMGEVYAALDRELNDRVALKTISSTLAADPKIVERFKLELRLARSIAHPSVCRVLEFGRHELSSGASQCFFTLQFIAGVTLRQRLIERGPLELTSALALAQDLALGLQAIHEQNVVHRDIKPENVMLPSAAAMAAAVWVDFGLARVDLRETRSAGVLAGTPDYVAPELLRGDIASRASDLYGFGVVLFEILTGALPFARSASFAAAAEQARVQLAPPSALRPEVPPALDALVLDCLHGVPARRPASAEQVALRLSDITHTLQNATKSPEGGAIAERRVTARWQWGFGAALVATVAATFYGLHSQSSASMPESSAPAVAAPAATVATASSAAIALEPASPDRKVEPKRWVAAASAAVNRSAAPAASQPPPVTDFGGRR